MTTLDTAQISQEPIRRVYVDTEFGQMHVRVASNDRSENSPLLCLHMTPQSGKSFENFMSAARVHRTIIAPDYHGYGASTPPPENVDVTIQDYARTIWQAMDEQGIGELDLLGHHTGSKVAVEMARQRPGAARNLVLIAAACSPYTPLSPDDRTFAPQAPDADGADLRAFWDSLKNMLGSKCPPEVLHSYYCDYLRAGRGYKRGFKAAYEYNAFFPAAMAELSQPTLVINPHDDLVEMTPKVMKHLKNADYLEKPDWGHGFFDSQTQDSVTTIISGLDQLSKEQIDKARRDQDRVLDSAK